MKFKRIISILLLLISTTLLQASTTETRNFYSQDNCVGSKWKDANGNPLSIEKKFGPGSKAITRCLSHAKKAKVVFQINRLCKNASCTGPYAINNIINQINDYKITHGMKPSEYEIIVVVMGRGWKLILDNDAITPHPKAKNPFQKAMKKLVNDYPSVKVLFCQNTANKKGVVTANMIKGVGFVTAGISAITDLQDLGYRYVQP